MPTSFRICLLATVQRAGHSLFASALCLSLSVGFCAASLGDEEPSADSAGDDSNGDSISYARDVLPVLRARCQGCHQPARLLGGVDLTASAGFFGVGDSGTSIVAPGKPDESELINQITPDEDGDALMPSEGPALTAEQVDLIGRWIAEGAKIDLDELAMPRFDADHPPTYNLPPIISAIDVSPDGSLIAVSGVSETLLLDAEAAREGRRQIVGRLIGLSERIQSIRFSPEGDRIAVAGGQPGRLGELQIWDVESGELLVSHTATTDTLFGGAWSPDGTRVAFGASDTDLHVIDAETGEQVIVQGAHTDWVLATEFSADGSHVVSGSRDMTLRLVETTEGRFVDNITSVSPNVPGAIIFALARHPREDLLAVADELGVPRTYRVHRDVRRRIGDDNNLFRAYPTMPGRVMSVAFSPSGDQLAAASGDISSGQIRLMSSPPLVGTPDEIKKIQNKTVDQRSGDDKKKLDEYHRQGAELTATIDMPGSMFAVAYHPDGGTLFSGGADGLLRVHSASNASVLAAFCPGPLEAEADGRDAGAVQTAETDDAPRFLTDVMPVMAKLGCNAGTCHGAAIGQNGFRLSLRGYDPLSDFQALTEDVSGRRTNRTQPDQSLMLLKATGLIPHGGGAVVEADSRRYKTLLDWIAAGAKYDTTAPRVEGIELSPTNPVLQQAGEKIAMHATAVYTDGTRRDVTADTFIESGDTERATADENGVVTALRRGEAAVLARYEGAYAATTLTVMGDRSGFEWAQRPVFNHIDELVDVKLKRMKIVASDVCSDEEFLRRVYLDLTGLPPTVEELREFLGDTNDSREKRSAVIERLIGNEAFVEHWTNYWADLLLVNGRHLGREGASGYRSWIRQAVDENLPYDQFVRQIITASGSNREHPAASYFKVLQKPDAIMEATTQVFLGVRFNCNKCHDHPFERWTQDQYYGLAAFFADVKLQKDPESGDRKIAGSAVEEARPLYEIVDDSGGGEVLHARTGDVASAEFPFEHEWNQPESGVLRQRAAEWLVSPRNRYFASSYVNRIWAQLTGAGLIEPVDDIRAGNPPSNPELLDWLTREFVDAGFDTRHLIRTICDSRSYQLSPATNTFNQGDARNYSHALPRRLPAETLFDAVYHVVGSETRLPGVPPGTRAAALPDGTIDLETGLLSTLGKPARESGCVCERSNDLQLGPVLALVNGPAFAEAIADPDNSLAKLESSLSDDKELATELFLRVLMRDPTEKEIQLAIELLSEPVGELDELVAARDAREAQLRPGYDPWRQANRPVDWQVLHPAKMASTMGAELSAEGDGSIVSTGDVGKGSYRIVADTTLDRLYGLRVEALADDRLPSRGPGRADNGNFVLSKIRVFAAPLDQRDDLKEVKLRSAEADYSQGNYGVNGAIDAKDDSGWAIGGQTGRDHTAAFAFARPREFSSGARIVVELDHQHDDAKHLLGRFRLSVTGAEAPLLRSGPTADVADLLRIPEGDLDETQREEIYRRYLQTDPTYRELQRGAELLKNPRLSAVQDLAWALINSPAFLFNH